MILRQLPVVAEDQLQSMIMGLLSRSRFVRSWRIAIAASFVLHVGVLLAFALQIDLPKGTATTPPTLILLPPPSDSESTAPAMPTASDEAVASALNVSEIQKEIDQFERDPEGDPSDKESQEASSYVASQIQRSVRIGQKRSPERNEKDLSVLGERLRRESSEKSVDEMATFLRRVTGAPRANQKVPSQPDRPIDPKTAQVEDVALVVDDQGKSHYMATMVDANGVTIEVEMETDVGEQLHRTMKLIKANPLLERVYRQMVMGLLDKMLQPQTQKVPD